MWTLRIKLCSATSSRSWQFCFFPLESVASRAIHQKSWFHGTERGSRHRSQKCTAHLSQRYVHTAKSWKFRANPKLTESDVAGTPYLACEDGKSAIPHSEVLATLNACKSLEEQVYAFSSLMSLNPQEIENRQKFCKSLSQAFKRYLPESKLSQFGSGMNLLGFKGSDIDVCIRTTPNVEKPLEYVKTASVPTLDDVLSGTVDSSVITNLHPYVLLRFLRRAIRSHCEDVKEPILLIKARCPLLRFYHEKYDLFCDFSCENTPAIRNTKLLRFIAHMDNRTRPLIQVLRYWGKTGKFVGDLDMFSSYAFSLLVVYYLQNTTPPVMPPLNELIAKADYLNFGDIEDDDLLISSLKCVPVSENKQSIEELLRGFFFFYLFYDFKRVMLILSSSSVPIREFQPPEENETADVFEKRTVCLQDPYRHSLNAAAGLANKSVFRFLNSLTVGYKLFHNSKALLPGLGSENWGLSQLFESSIHCMHDSKNTPEPLTDSFTVDLPSLNSGAEKVLVEASHMVKHILEYCFLFKCREMNVQPHKYETVPLLKFCCESVHNTCAGRNQVLKEKFGVSTTIKCLELEHLISLELVRQKQHEQKALFRLHCECYSEGSINSPCLKVNLEFQSGNMPTILFIFLKEHVPRILKRALQESNL